MDPASAHNHCALGQDTARSCVHRVLVRLRCECERRTMDANEPTSAKRRSSRLFMTTRFPLATNPQQERTAMKHVIHKCALTPFTDTALH